MKYSYLNYFLPAGLLICLGLLIKFNDELIGGFVFSICGLSFLTVGIFILNKNRKIRDKGTKTTAEIVNFVEERFKGSNGISRLYHFPIVKFIDQNGLEITQKLDSSDNPKRVNKQINIIYLKSKNDYEIIKDSDWWEKNLPILSLLFGTIFLIIGIIWFVNNL